MKFPTVEQLEKFRKMDTGSVGREEIAAAVRCSLSSVDRWRRLQKQQAFDAYLTRIRKFSNSKKKGEKNDGHVANHKQHIGRDIRIGIAFAETERFIANLAERIEIPATLLRRRLSELLVRTPLR